MYKYSKLNLNTYFCAQLLRSNTNVLTQHVGAAMQQLSAKVFKLRFEYLHVYSPKSGDFCRKVAKLHRYNVL